MIDAFQIGSVLALASLISLAVGAPLASGVLALLAGLMAVVDFYVRWDWGT